MLYTVEQIIKKFEEILYEELNIKQKIRNFLPDIYNVTYIVDAKNISTINKNSFYLLLQIIKIDRKAIRLVEIQIQLKNSSNKLIFGYYFNYKEDEIGQFFINAKKILQLINTKLSDPQIRDFYHKMGLIGHDFQYYSKATKNIDIKNNYHQIPKEIIYSTSYIQIRRQLLIFKIVQLVKKYIKEEYKNKIYVQKKDENIQILDADKITLELYIYHDQTDDIFIINLIISWAIPKLVTTKKYRKFLMRVGIIPTINEKEALDRFVQKTMISFNEIDDYVRLLQEEN